MENLYGTTANSYIVIDLQKLRRNVLKITAVLGNGVKFLPVLKGNAYGHGLAEVGAFLVRECGIDMLCVGPSTEAECLRSFGLTCDILTLGGTPFNNIPYLPVLKSTINILDKPEFDRMKPTAIVINTARGSIVNQEALIDALITRKIAGCALDTIDPEPMPQDHPLLMLPEEISERVIMTPHIAGTTDEAFSRMLRDAIDNFVRVSSGEAPLRVVNLWPTGQGTGAETISSDNAPKCKHASTLN